MDGQPAPQADEATGHWRAAPPEGSAETTAYPDHASSLLPAEGQTSSPELTIESSAAPGVGPARVESTPVTSEGELQAVCPAQEVEGQTEVMITQGNVECNDEGVTNGVNARADVAAASGSEPSEEAAAATAITHTKQEPTAEPVWSTPVQVIDLLDSQPDAIELLDSPSERPVPPWVGAGSSTSTTTTRFGVGLASAVPRPRSRVRAAAASDPSASSKAFASIDLLEDSAADGAAAAGISQGASSQTSRKQPRHVGRAAAPSEEIDLLNSQEDSAGVSTGNGQPAAPARPPASSAPIDLLDDEDLPPNRAGGSATDDAGPSGSAGCSAGPSSSADPSRRDGDLQAGDGDGEQGLVIDLLADDDPTAASADAVRPAAPLDAFCVRVASVAVWPCDRPVASLAGNPSIPHPSGCTPSRPSQVIDLTEDDASIARQLQAQLAQFSQPAVSFASLQVLLVDCSATLTPPSSPSPMLSPMFTIPTAQGTCEAA